jgi:hypothetical protein
MPDRDPLLVERERTHGAFATNAEIFFRFRKVAGIDGPKAQQLALEMIYLKLARATCNPSVVEHWLDIAGYAKLAAEACPLP